MFDDAERATTVGDVGHNCEHAGGFNSAFGSRDDNQGIGRGQKAIPARQGFNVG
jgi:hypothetical protein